MSKPATIKDIAARTGISNRAVSAALSEQASHVRVSAATRVRVVEAARQMNYRPNRAARSLRSKTTNVIGLYTDGYLDPTLSFVLPIIGGLHRGCCEHGRHLLLHGLVEGRTPEDVCAELTDGHLDGLVLLTTPWDPLVPLLAETALPVVTVVDALPGLPAVVVDDASGSRMLAARLASQGHQAVAYVSSGVALTSAVRREAAFRKAAAEHSLEVVEGHTWDQIGSPEWRATAAVCWNDVTAYKLLEECRRRGLRVPEDLAVVGFDGVGTTHPTPWRLTTILAPWVEVAHTAATVLISHLEGKAIPSETVLPVEFVPGDTD